jgi:8-oxo-dGTP pyrophosphatase MutT (NUDIX family)
VDLAHSKALHTIGGRVERGETPEDAARRELAEEVSLAARNVVLWTAWQPLSKIDWAVYLFWASGLEDWSSSNADPGEDIDIQRVPASDLLRFRGIQRIYDVELRYQLGCASMIRADRKRMRASYARAVKSM